MSSNATHFEIATPLGLMVVTPLDRDRAMVSSLALVGSDTARLLRLDSDVFSFTATMRLKQGGWEAEPRENRQPAFIVNRHRLIQVREQPHRPQIEAIQSAVVDGLASWASTHQDALDRAADSFGLSDADRKVRDAREALDRAIEEAAEVRKARSLLLAEAGPYTPVADPADPGLDA